MGEYQQSCGATNGAPLFSSYLLSAQCSPLQVLSHIGQFGAVQRRIFLLLSLVAAAAGIAVVVFAFTGSKIR